MTLGLGAGDTLKKKKDRSTHPNNLTQLTSFNDQVTESRWRMQQNAINGNPKRAVLLVVEEPQALLEAIVALLSAGVFLSEKKWKTKKKQKKKWKSYKKL